MIDCAAFTGSAFCHILWALEGAAKMSSWAPVYAFVKRIPRGRVITYGGLAKAIKLRGGARAAGHAMAASPSGKGVPWHRVVGYGGKLLIREPYASLQRKLLESEGVQMTEFRVDMKKHAWTPAKTTRKNTRKSARKRRSK
jgi:methylated-DNA-protein-cysteine methyltransferase-like protein